MTRGWREWLERRRCGFAALLTPQGVDVVLRAVRGGTLAVKRSMRAAETFRTGVEAAERLADLIEALGGRGSRLSLVLSGFGVRYHVLELPLAPPGVLAPVVRREFLRLEPDLIQPVIAFGQSLPVGRLPVTSPSLLAAGVPRPLLESIVRVLASRGIALEHLTVVPQAVQRLYHTFGNNVDPALLILFVPELTVIAAFHQGQVRMCWEPIVRQAAGGPLELRVLGDRIAAGRHFVQQASRGQGPSAVLIAAEADERPPIEQFMAESVELPAQQLGPEQASPGGLLALGGAIDAASRGSLNLLPRGLQPSVATDPAWSTAVAAACGIAVATLGWLAWQNVGRATTAADLRSVRPAVEAATAQFTGHEPAARARYHHAMQLAVLGTLERERAVAPLVLSAITHAAPAAVRFDSLTIERRDDGWHARLSGIAAGRHAASAMQAVDRMYRNIRDRLPAATITLARLGDAGTLGANNAVVGFTLALVLENDLTQAPEPVSSAREAPR